MDAPRNSPPPYTRKKDWYVAQCLEVDVASQGRSIPEALSNLAEAVELYLDEVEDPQQHVTATPSSPRSRYLAPREPGTVRPAVRTVTRAIESRAR